MAAPARRSRRTRNEPPEIVPPKSDEEHGEDVDKEKERDESVNNMEKDDGQDKESSDAESEGGSKGGTSEKNVKGQTRKKAGATSRRSQRSGKPIAKSKKASSSSSLNKRRRRPTLGSSDDQRSKDGEDASSGEGSEAGEEESTKPLSPVTTTSKQRRQHATRGRKKAPSSPNNAKSADNESSGEEGTSGSDEGDGDGGRGRDAAESSGDESDSTSASQNSKKSSKETDLKAEGKDGEDSSDNEPLSVMKRKREARKQKLATKQTSSRVASDSSDGQNEYEPQKKALSSAATSASEDDGVNSVTPKRTNTKVKSRRKNPGTKAKKGSLAKSSGDEGDADEPPQKRTRRRRSIKKAHTENQEKISSAVSTNDEDSSDESTKDSRRTSQSTISKSQSNSRSVSPVEDATKSDEGGKHSPLETHPTEDKDHGNKTTKQSEDGVAGENPTVAEMQRKGRDKKFEIPQLRSRSNSIANDEASGDDKASEASTHLVSRRSRRKRRKPNKLGEEESSDEEPILSKAVASEQKRALIESSSRESERRKRKALGGAYDIFDAKLKQEASSKSKRTKKGDSSHASDDEASEDHEFNTREDLDEDIDGHEECIAKEPESQDLAQATGADKPDADKRMDKLYVSKGESESDRSLRSPESVEGASGGPVHKPTDFEGDAKEVPESDPGKRDPLVIKDVQEETVSEAKHEKVDGSAVHADNENLGGAVDSTNPDLDAEADGQMAAPAGGMDSADTEIAGPTSAQSRPIGVDDLPSEDTVNLLPGNEHFGGAGAETSGIAADQQLENGSDEGKKQHAPVNVTEDSTKDNVAKTPTNDGHEEETQRPLMGTNTRDATESDSNVDEITATETHDDEEREQSPSSPSGAAPDPTAQEGDSKQVLGDNGKESASAAEEWDQREIQQRVDEPLQGKDVEESLPAVSHSSTKEPIEKIVENKSRTSNGDMPPESGDPSVIENNETNETRHETADCDGKVISLRNKSADSFAVPATLEGAEKCVDNGPKSANETAINLNDSKADIGVHARDTPDSDPVARNDKVKEGDTKNASPPEREDARPGPTEELEETSQGPTSIKKASDIVNDTVNDIDRKTKVEETVQELDSKQGHSTLADVLKSSLDLVDRLVKPKGDADKPQGKAGDILSTPQNGDRWDQTMAHSEAEASNLLEASTRMESPEEQFHDAQMEFPVESPSQNPDPVPGNLATESKLNAEKEVALLLKDESAVAAEVRVSRSSDSDVHAKLTTSDNGQGGSLTSQSKPQVISLSPEDDTIMPQPTNVDLKTYAKDAGKSKTISARIEAYPSKEEEAGGNQIDVATKPQKTMNSSDPTNVGASQVGPTIEADAASFGPPASSLSDGCAQVFDTGGGSAPVGPQGLKPASDSEITPPSLEGVETNKPVSAVSHEAASSPRDEVSNAKRPANQIGKASAIDAAGESFDRQGAPLAGREVKISGENEVLAPTAAPSAASATIRDMGSIANSLKPEDIGRKGQFLPTSDNIDAPTGVLDYNAGIVATQYLDRPKYEKSTESAGAGASGKDKASDGISASQNVEDSILRAAPKEPTNKELHTGAPKTSSQGFVTKEGQTVKSEPVPELLPLPLAFDYEVRFGPSVSQCREVSPSPEHSVEKADGDSLKRVKTMLYAAGRKAHRGSGFERIFAEYWDAMALRLSDRLSSHTSERCQRAIDIFLRTNKLRKLHNRFIMSVMRRAARSAASHDDISLHVPPAWIDRVKTVRALPSALPERTPLEVLQANQLPSLAPAAPCYREAWDQSLPDPQPLGNERRRQKTLLAPKHEIASANLPGALIIDPLVRKVVEEGEMEVTDLAIWLMAVAVKEHSSNVLKAAIAHKEAARRSELAPRQLSFPRLLATGMKLPSKRDLSLDAKCALSDKGGKLTALDIYASTSSMPYGAIGSVGGSVSRAMLERSLHASFDDLPLVPRDDFAYVQHFITDQVMAEARTRKIPPKASKEDEQRNEEHNGANKADTTNQPNSFVVPPPAPPQPLTHAVDLNAQQTTASVYTPPPVPAVIGTQPTAQAPEVDDKSALTAAGEEDQKSLPCRMGRGAKDLAALMRRTTASSSPDPDPASKPDASSHASTDNPPTDPAPSAAPVMGSPSAQPTEDPKPHGEAEEAGGQRRGKGFGIKNLARMLAKKDVDPK